MATLTSPAGTFWDRSPAQSLAAASWGGASQLTLVHSLGATPDFIVVNVLSMQNLSGAYNPAIGALRGNSSINTIQFLGPANVTFPTTAFEAYCAVVHSFIR